MESLIFNDKKILFERKEGVYWIVVKSVCEALNVNYNRQSQNLREDPILKAAVAVQQLQVPGDQVRNLVCLPEKYVYGWIFQIRSDSPELLEYKRECYDILFNHFHGTLTKRAALYSEVAQAKKKKAELETLLFSIPEYQELLELRMKEARLWKNIRQTTNEEQSLFDDENL